MLGKDLGPYCDRRFYETAGITIEVRSELPMSVDTFDVKFRQFEVAGPGPDTVVIHHRFEPWHLDEGLLGEALYEDRPWAVYETGAGYGYVWISQLKPGDDGRRAAFFTRDHCQGLIYNDDLRRAYYEAGGVNALTLFPTDQILLARLLADREGGLLHAAGMRINGAGCLFAGHSEAGKSTLAGMLKERGALLCDDRNIFRREKDGFRVYGSWSHGDLREVSAANAPLRAVFFLHQAAENRLEPVADELLALRKLLACLVKPLVTPDWWEQMLDVVQSMAHEVPCYDLYFNKKGDVSDMIEEKVRG